MAATALLPGLSQINAWDTAHLGAAAASWTTTAETWEDAFTTVYPQAPFPGGTAWEGDAADAAVLRVGSDRLTVLGAVDALHDAASGGVHGRRGSFGHKQTHRWAARIAGGAPSAGRRTSRDHSQPSGGPGCGRGTGRELNHKCDSLFERHPIRSEPGRTAERETVNPGRRQPHLPSGTTAEHTRRSRHQADQNRPGRQGRARQT